MKLTHKIAAALLAALAIDAADGDAVVRNNTLCGGGSVSVNVPRAQLSSNVVRTGADATTGACAP